MHMYMYSNLYLRTYIYIYTYMHILCLYIYHIYIYIIYIYRCICVCRHACTGVYIPIYTYMHTHTYIYIYIYIIPNDHGCLQRSVQVHMCMRAWYTKYIIHRYINWCTCNVIPPGVIILHVRHLSRRHIHSPFDAKPGSRSEHIL